MLFDSKYHAILFLTFLLLGWSCCSCGCGGLCAFWCRLRGCSGRFLCQAYCLQFSALYGWLGCFCGLGCWFFFLSDLRGHFVLLYSFWRLFERLLDLICRLKLLFFLGDQFISIHFEDNLYKNGFYSCSAQIIEQNVIDFIKFVKFLVIEHRVSSLFYNLK